MRTSRLLRCLIALVLLAAIPSTAAADAARPKAKTTRTSQKKKTSTQPSGKSAPARQPAKATPSQADRLRRQQSSAQRKISETTSAINTNSRKLRNELNSLQSLNADIDRQQRQVLDLRSHIDSLSGAITLTTDSIRILEQQLQSLRQAYAHALRTLQPSARAMDTWAFIFSARTFSEAHSRLRYLQRFSQWRQSKALDINRAIDRIASQRQHLSDMRHRQDQAWRQARQVQLDLSSKQARSQQMVDNLRRNDTQLRAELARQKKQAAALDRELGRIIAAEQAKTARQRQAQADNGTADGPSAAQIASGRAKTLTADDRATATGGSFAANKGRLLFPVAGRYKIVRPFGRHPHPTQRRVVTDNSGIDIETPAGTTARAVYAGTVSAIFQQEGFHTIVMVRHGSYLTIYAGLSSAFVKVGQQVKAGQSLGSIFSDPADGDRTILHFEVRNERSKLDPTQWVR